MLLIPRARATALLAALSLAALLVLPGVALADTMTSVTVDASGHDGHDATDGDRPAPPPGTAAPRSLEVTTQRPGTPQAGDGDSDEGTNGPDDDTGGDGDTDQPTNDGEAGGADPDPTDDADTTITIPTPVLEEVLLAACAPHLVTFTRDGVDGDATAVALTSQAVDVAQPGWLHVSWETNTGTALDAVELLHTDGTRSALPATATGTVYDVVSVTFCGRAADTAEAVDITDAPTQGTGDANAPDTDSDDSAARTEDAANGTSDAAVSLPAAARSTTSRTAAAPSGSATIDAAAADEAEVEVLGIQIVAPERDTAPEAADEPDEPDDEPAAALAAAPALAGASSSSGGMHPLLLAAAIAAGLAGAVTVLRGTPRTTTSSSSQGDAS